MQSLLFVHIPKTAGTSFRTSLEEVLGPKKIIKDYADHSPVTSESIIEMVYKEKDLAKFYRFFPKTEHVLSGHFWLNKYQRMFDAPQLTTFVRNPVDRVISEFHHFKRHQNYQGSLYAFLDKRRNQNLMSRFLAGIPWQAFGFMGVSERYNESLELFAAHSGITLPELHKNVAPKNYSNISEEDLSLIKQTNLTDIKLYQQIATDFEQRLDFTRSRKPYANAAWWRKPGKAMIEGFAFWPHSDEPVTLDLLVSNKRIATLTADSLSDVGYLANAPRYGLVGFEYKLPVKEQKQLLVKVSSTGQRVTRGF
ncbi:MAG: hypothetical protein CMF12_07000 [Idiomarina sp.]|uniref:sulfotransferase family 2 domain-containing protein n=1 Tax=Idiomarina sp. TaxID=1874361 RepID=UPI000C675BCF|nr:sulfotransferase family 2 domain-containing protein [Idiomarina sp.]MBT42258.1 hypothetical protein [Idiomarina sp.]